MTPSTADWLESVGHQWLHRGQPCLVGVYNDNTFMRGRGFSNPSLVLLYLIEQLTLPWMWLVSLMVMMRMVYCGGADLDTLYCV